VYYVFILVRSNDFIHWYHTIAHSACADGIGIDSWTAVLVYLVGFGSVVYVH